jgi:hypothetical protein
MTEKIDVENGPKTLWFHLQDGVGIAYSSIVDQDRRGAMIGANRFGRIPNRVTGSNIALVDRDKFFFVCKIR